MLKKTRYFKTVYVILIILLISTGLYGTEKLPVMLKVRSNFNLDISIINTLRSGAEEVLTAKGYQLISKVQQEEALREQVDQRESDCLDDACLVDTGKMLAAQKFFIIDINRVKNEYFFKGKFVNLETGSIERTVVKVYDQNISNISKLLEFSKELTIEALGVEKRVHYFTPYGFTDFILASNIKFLNLGAGLKFITLKIGDNSTIEINGKIYMNVTDRYYYTDLEFLYKYNLYKNFNIGFYIPFRMLFESNDFKRGTGILPSLLLNYNIIKKYGLFVDFDLSGGVALSFMDNVDTKLFIKTGINFGYEF